jgi:imidazolonepropionase
MERADWVRAVCDELIPEAVREGLVDAVDVYVEDIAFSLDDLREVARCASQVGLPLRCHADQLGPSGAAEAAVALDALSADHLNHVSAAGTRRSAPRRPRWPSCSRRPRCSCARRPRTSER